jgi:hypothetical protein
LVGFGAGAEQDVSDGELDFAERGSAAGDEGVCELEKVVVGGLGEGFGQLLALSDSRARGRTSCMAVSRIEEVDFSPERLVSDLGTKIPPSFQTPTHCRIADCPAAPTFPCGAFLGLS